MTFLGPSCRHGGDPAGVDGAISAAARRAWCRASRGPTHHETTQRADIAPVGRGRDAQTQQRRAGGRLPAPARGAMTARDAARRGRCAGALSRRRIRTWRRRPWPVTATRSRRAANGAPACPAPARRAVGRPTRWPPARFVFGASERSKTATALVTGPTANEHRGAREHTPRHPANVEPGAGSATSVSRSPKCPWMTQRRPQSSDALRTVPDPPPCLNTRNDTPIVGLRRRPGRRRTRLGPRSGPRTVTRAHQVARHRLRRLARRGLPRHDRPPDRADSLGGSPRTGSGTGRSRGTSGGPLDRRHACRTGRRRDRSWPDGAGR